MAFSVGSSNHSCSLESQSDHGHSSSNSAATDVSADTHVEADEGDSENSAERRHVVRDSPQSIAEHDPLQRQLLDLVVSLQKQVTASGIKVDRLSAQKKQLKTEIAQLKEVEVQSRQEIEQLQGAVQRLEDLLQVHSVCLRT